MCGIVAYIGKKNCKNILIDGLKRLEYRGYDSAGIAIMVPQGPGSDASGNNVIEVVKEAGKIREMEGQAQESSIDGKCGIGHTRWATHGEPTKVNAHPHKDCSGKIAVIHNGIIENFEELRSELKEKGHKFISDTDTEVLPHMLEEYYDGDLLLAMQRLMGRIKGSGAIV
ncbi:MAG: hypothetical protein V3R31_04505, partial [Candidatus Humimicrobiaceae bacterium]